MKNFICLPLTLSMLTACGGSGSGSETPKHPPELDITQHNYSDILSYTSMVPDLLLTFAEMSIEAHGHTDVIEPNTLCGNRGSADVEMTATSLRINLNHCHDAELNAVLNGSMTVGLQSVAGGTEYDMAIDLSMSSDYTMEVVGSALITHTTSGTSEQLEIQSSEGGIALSAFDLTETISEFALNKTSDSASVEYQLNYRFTYVSEIHGGVVTCRTETPLIAPYFTYPKNVDVSCGPLDEKLSLSSTDDNQYLRITYPGSIGIIHLSMQTYFEPSMLAPVTPSDIPMLYEHIQKPSAEFNGLRSLGKGQADPSGEYVYLETTQYRQTSMRVESIIHKLRLSDLNIVSEFILDDAVTSRYRWWLSSGGQWLYMLTTVTEPDGTGKLPEILIIDTSDMTVAHTVDPLPVFAPRESHIWDTVGIGIAANPAEEGRWTLTGLAATTPEQVIVAEFRHDELLRETRKEIPNSRVFYDEIASVIDESGRLFINLEEDNDETTTLRFNLAGDVIEHELTVISPVRQSPDRYALQRNLFAFEGKLYADFGHIFDAETLLLEHENPTVNRVYLSKPLRRLIDTERGLSMSLTDASYFRQPDYPKYWPSSASTSLVPGDSFFLYMDHNGDVHRIGLADAFTQLP
ncbi:hypothetical protein KUV56_03295 [Ferrimonas balearica]|uniref:hypothetical protein n=1 Tax=Ferrimonas balearica TaxID=44012 RepID=UPI001C5704A3|nr:hypothetical protein [Ferrimonas balearica]MBW3138555.1 hypothetical protein [Ferrimonas balearica]